MRQIQAKGARKQAKATKAKAEIRMKLQIVKGGKGDVGLGSYESPFAASTVSASSPLGLGPAAGEQPADIGQHSLMSEKGIKGGEGR